MIQFFKNNIEPRKKLRTAEIIVLIALVLGSIISLCVGLKECILILVKWIMYKAL